MRLQPTHRTRTTSRGSQPPHARTSAKSTFWSTTPAQRWGAPAEDHPLDAWDKVMNLNVRGIFLLTQAVGRASMIPRRRGRVINVASIAGLSGNAPGTMSTIAYNTSKGALVNFTRTLAAEWGKYNITVNALAPGFFPSKMTKGVIKELGEDASGTLGTTESPRR